MNTTQKMIAAVAIVAVLAVAAVGAGFAYTASVSNTDNEAGVNYITLMPDAGEEGAKSFSGAFTASAIFDTITNADGTITYTPKEGSTATVVTIENVGQVIKYGAIDFEVNTANLGGDGYSLTLAPATAMEGTYIVGAEAGAALTTDAVYSYLNTGAGAKTVLLTGLDEDNVAIHVELYTPLVAPGSFTSLEFDFQAQAAEDMFVFDATEGLAVEIPEGQELRTGDMPEITTATAKFVTADTEDAVEITQTPVLAVKTSTAGDTKVTLTYAGEVAEVDVKLINNVTAIALVGSAPTDDEDHIVDLSTLTATLTWAAPDVADIPAETNNYKFVDSTYAEFEDLTEVVVPEGGLTFYIEYTGDYAMDNAQPLRSAAIVVAYADEP